MSFKNANAEAGLPVNAPFQVGKSNLDNNQVVEQGIGIPWASDPAGSYLYYDCAVGVMLDSGIVVHNRLPQVNRTPDTLSSGFLEDRNLDKITVNGVNLTCKDQYQDIVQRMGHARYWFRLWGQAIRVGYKVPIPGIKFIGGVPTVPYDKNPQWAYNAVAPGGSYGGVVLWRAQWSLWYTTAVPPVNQDIPAVDLLGHVNGADKVPSQIQSPYSQADDDASQLQPIVAGAKPR